MVSPTNLSSLGNTPDPYPCSVPAKHSSTRARLSRPDNRRRRSGRASTHGLDQYYDHFGDDQGAVHERGAKSARMNALDMFGVGERAVGSLIAVCAGRETDQSEMEGIRGTTA